jgi:exodeoxyribonuclease V alpha subunit
VPRGVADSSPTETLRGTIERIVFSSDDTHYTVARLTPDDATADGCVTIVGTIPALVEGELVLCEGRWQEHKRYGRQFAVERYSSVAPATQVGLERYLGSRLIKGVGPTYAKKIVHHFGDNTLDVLDHDPQRLLEVAGIGRKMLQRIRSSWSEHRGVRDVMVYLQGLGISPAYAARVHKALGAAAINTVQMNPYILASEVKGIGFKTADRIAKAAGFPTDSPERIRAGLGYLLGELAAQGHTCYPRERLVAEAAKLLDVDAERVVSALDDEIRDERLATERNHPGEPVLLPRLRDAEFQVAELLRTINCAESSLHDVEVGRSIAWAEQRNHIELDPKQREAIGAVLEHKVVVITGGPGVGKTTIINCIIPILKRHAMRVLLAAPTGRAAKRLAETTGEEAKTIHRLLNWNPIDGSFACNADAPLEADAIILDETSMIDIALMRDLLLAVPLTAVLVLVGDVDQLPSVGPGNVLRDIIASETVAVRRLDRIFRQGERSPIVLNAHRINHGRMPELDPAGNAEGFYFIERDEPEAALDTIRELVTQRIPNRFEMHSVDDVQVMAPMYRGTTGVDNLNAALRAALNPALRDEVRKMGRAFAVGDKVMQTRNDYDKDVFNGDIGRVHVIDHCDEKLVVRFEDQYVEYEFDELDGLQPAYAISVHKSQGSEYPAVVIALATHHYVMLQRNLLYTAVTRARRLAVIVGDRKALAVAVRNDRIRRRYTLLTERLRGTDGPAERGAGGVSAEYPEGCTGP